MMPRLHNGDSTEPYRIDQATRWLTLHRDRSLSRVRGPFVAVASRVGLASARCDELREELGRMRHRLLNVSAHTRPETVLSLEERVLRLEHALHAERLSLWKDLMPLAQSSRDAAVDAMRQSYLAELRRVFGGEQSDQDR